MTRNNNRPKLSADSSSSDRTLIFALFEELLTTLEQAIHTNDHLPANHASHPQFKTWLRQTESSWDRAIDIKRVLLNTPVICTADNPVKLMTLMIHFAMTTETTGELRKLQGFIDRRSNWLRCPLHAHGTRKTHELLDRGHGFIRDITGVLGHTAPVDDPGIEPSGYL